MNTARLLKLAAFLDTLPREKFDFSLIATQGGKPMREALKAGATRCGTVGCAIGWLPACFPRGLKWGGTDRRFPDVVLRSDELLLDFRAAEAWFDITSTDSMELFHPGVAYSGLADEATPKQVARHIRKWVREERRATPAGRGPSSEDKNDG